MISLLCFVTITTTLFCKKNLTNDPKPEHHIHAHTVTVCGYGCTKILPKEVKEEPTENEILLYK